MINLVRSTSLVLFLWLALFSCCQAQQGAEPPGFVADYLEPDDATNHAVYEVMKKEKLLEASAEFLNQLFVMPRQVHLVMARPARSTLSTAPIITR